VLLVAGDKSGGSERRFHAELIRKADGRFDEHVSRLKQERKNVAMATTLKDKMDALSPERRGKVEACSAALVAEELSLRDLRHAHELTQEDVGKSLGIGQEGVSRLEKRADLLISTLRSYVEAMGGHLRLIGEFPNRPPIVLTGLAAMEGKATRRSPTGRNRQGQRLQLAALPSRRRR
jgi:transcriptional regulator with XRE-family HTH domain